MSIFVCNDCCTRETHSKVATAKEQRICAKCNGKMRVAYRYGESIDREELKRRLGLKDKMPADLEGVWVGVDIPGDSLTGYRLRRHHGGGINHPVVADRPTHYYDEHGYTMYDTVVRGYKSLGRMTVVVRKTPKVSREQVVARGYGGRDKSSSHRVFIICPQCGCEVPTGRYHQHAGSKKCEQGDPTPETKRMIVAATLYLCGVPFGVDDLAKVPVTMPRLILRDWMGDIHSEYVKEMFSLFAGIDGTEETWIRDYNLASGPVPTIHPSNYNWVDDREQLSAEQRNELERYLNG